MKYVETTPFQVLGATFFEVLEYLDNPHFEFDYQDESDYKEDTTTNKGSK